MEDSCQELVFHEESDLSHEFSYNVHEYLTPGIYDVDNVPDDVDSELESFFQSDRIPPFLYEPQGRITVKVT